MSDALRVLVVGASGLVGSETVRIAAGRRDLQLIALARREFALPRGARMELLVADADRWQEAVAAIAPDRVICALGTTWRKADRDETSFRAVDHDLVLTIAHEARSVGATNFVLVSSVGADAGSSNFYLRTKGETEQALTALKFRRLDILRPGLLKGERGTERRLGERIGIAMSPLAGLFLHGERRRYRAIAADEVAAGALQAVREKAAGRFVHENDGILRLARRLSAQ